jgi:hypothetical protein
MNKVHAYPVQSFRRGSPGHIAGIGLDLFICQNESFRVCDHIDKTTKGLIFVLFCLDM